MLSSWKEIAQFFGKGVRTVQRWEKTLDLPIHRPPGAPNNVVLAKESDLEEWMNRGMHEHSATGDVLARSFTAISNAIHEAHHAEGEEGRRRLESLKDRVEKLLTEVKVDGDRGSMAA